VGRLSSQATRDALTGALNSRGLEAEAAIAHDRDMRSGNDTTVVEIDLDGSRSSTTLMVTRPATRF
jgi:GGDEF domain-containing protein